MKSTYKLIGVFWDKKPHHEIDILHQNKNDFILDYLIKERTLFDDSKIVRKVDISKIFSLEKETEINSFINDLRYCDEIVLSLDFFPQNNQKVVKMFYELRVKQICFYLEQKLFPRKISIMSDFKNRIFKEAI